MIYTCAKCGQTFWGKNNRVKYCIIDPSIFSSINSIIAYLFGTDWYLCDICTKETGIETLFKEESA